MTNRPTSRVNGSSKNHLAALRKTKPIARNGRAVKVKVSTHTRNRRWDSSAKLSPKTFLQTQYSPAIRNVITGGLVEYDFPSKTTRSTMGVAGGPPPPPL